MPVHYSRSQLFGINTGKREAPWIKCARVAIITLIGATLLLAAIGKLLDNRHFADVLAQWQLFPRWSLLPLGVIVSLAELVLAIWLFSGWRLIGAALLSVLFHLGYSIATVVTLLRGISLPDCGCFGILFPHPLSWTMAVEDFGFAGLSVVLYLLARTRYWRIQELR